MKLSNRCFPFLLLLFGVFFICATPAICGPLVPKLLGDTGGVNDHPHNLSKNSTNVTKSATEDRICIFCHTPHGGSKSGPLWNRVDPAGPFPLYDDGGSGSLHLDVIAAADYNTASTAGYPNGSSRLCMSCHDGVTAVGDVIVGGSLGAMTMPGTGVVQLNLSHPISFIYDATVRDALLPGVYTLPAAASVVNVDGNNRVQCTTCHDPHTDTRVGAYGNPMWRLYTNEEDTNADYDNTCLVCHSGVPTPVGTSGLH